MAETIRIDGLKELGERMRALSTEVNLKISKSACGKAAGVVKDQAITNAPRYPVAHKLEGVVVEPGNLKRNIVVKKIRSPLTAEYIVTVRGKKKDSFAARYGRLVEFGTRYIAPNSFLRKAFESKKQQAIVTMKVELQIGIEKAAKA